MFKNYASSLNTYFLGNLNKQDMEKFMGNCRNMFWYANSYIGQN